MRSKTSAACVALSFMLLAACGGPTRMPQSAYRVRDDGGRRVATIEGDGWTFMWNADGSATTTNKDGTIAVNVWAAQTKERGVAMHERSKAHLARKQLTDYTLDEPVPGGTIHCGARRAGGAVQAMCLRIDDAAMSTGVLYQAVEATATVDHFDAGGRLWLLYDVLASAQGFTPKTADDGS